MIVPRPRKKRGKINVGTTTRREIAVGVGTACDGRGSAHGQGSITQENEPGTQEGAHDQEKCLLGSGEYGKLGCLDKNACRILRKIYKKIASVSGGCLSNCLYSPVESPDVEKDPYAMRDIHEEGRALVARGSFHTHGDDVTRTCGELTNRAHGSPR